MKYRFTALLMIVGIMVSGAMARAAEQINTQAIAAGGFSNVAALLQQMTPEQRAQVMAAAQAKAQEMQNMTPNQRAALQAQLAHVDNTLKVEQVDPAKLDISKSKNVASTQADMNKYQTLYAQGKINNSAVKTHAESQE